MSFIWGGGAGGGVQVCLSFPPLFADEFRVCCREVLDLFEVDGKTADCVSGGLTVFRVVRI
jgi:hypothetical protein